MKKLHPASEASRNRQKLDNAAIHQALARIVRAADEINREVDLLLAQAAIRSAPLPSARPISPRK